VLGPAAAGLVLVAGVAALRGGARPPVPVQVVARGPFRNDVVAFGLLQAVHSTPVTVPADLQRPMRVAWLAPAGPVKRGEPVVLFDPSEVEKQYDDGRSDRASAEQRRTKAAAEGGQTRAGLALDHTVAAEELHRAEDVAPSDAQIFSRNEIIESRLDRTLLRKRVATTEAKVGPTERLSAADLALSDIERGKAELRIRQAEKSLRALKVTAPHDGILVFPLSWRGDAVAVGDTVWPSQTVAELPDLSALEARVFVLEADGGAMAAGQKARVEIEGQPQLVFDARVTRVDALAKNRDRQSPVKYFETTLQFEKGVAAALKPGQRVRATIVAASLEDALTIPRGALFEKDGRRLVYRLEHGRFQAVEVAVGPRGLARIVITKGLAQGDRVALQDPERRATAGPPAAPPGGAGPPRGR
jgi:RND family efflux transporter MFP subunit